MATSRRARGTAASTEPAKTSKRTSSAKGPKRPFDIDEMMRRIRDAVRDYPDAAMFALRAVEEYGGELPADAEVLQSFAGVGPKCANLALGVAHNVRRVSVDVHVWRVVNRWGYVTARTPEATMLALEEVLPQKYWIEI